MRNNISTTENQQAIIIDVIEVKMGVHYNNNKERAEC